MSYCVPVGTLRDLPRRRLGLLAATLAAAVGVTACGGSGTYTAPSSQTSTSTTTPVVGPSKSCIDQVSTKRLRNGYQGLVYATNYGSATGATAAQRCWQRVQVPNSLGRRQTSRIELTRAPGSASDPRRPNGSVMRVELKPFDGGSAQGDVTDTGGYRANRAEVLARLDPYGTPAENWPDPVNSTRWYSYSFYLSPDWAFSDEDSHWLDLTQWKGEYSGPRRSPSASRDASSRLTARTSTCR